MLEREHAIFAAGLGKRAAASSRSSSQGLVIRLTILAVSTRGWAYSSKAGNTLSSHGVLPELVSTVSTVPI